MASALTDSSGNYKFTGLKSGNYKISEGSCDGQLDGKDSSGCGTATIYNDVICNIALNSGATISGNNFAELHITSTRFDEPRALGIVGQCTTAISIHGRADDGEPEAIWLGGMHAQMVARIETGLSLCGFVSYSNGHRFRADNPRNICNRGLSGRGTQIEVPMTLRQRMRSDGVLRRRFVEAVRESLSEADAM